MADYVINGTFSSGISSWTTGEGGAPATWNGFDGYQTPGCARIEAAAGSPTVLYQVLTTPALTTYWWRIRYALKPGTGAEENSQPNYFTIRIWDGAGNKYYEYVPAPTKLPEGWSYFSADVLLPPSTEMQAHFQQLAEDGAWYVDDVSLQPIAVESGWNCENLALELMKRRNDLAGLKHGPERYHQVINQAIAATPRALWRMDQNEAIATLADTYRYSLAAVAGLSRPEQVVQVRYKASGGDVAVGFGPWGIEDDEGTLSLVIAEPLAAGGTFQVSYLTPWSQLDCADLTDTTNLDAEWLLARAMTLLLAEADSLLTGEDPAEVARDLQYWDAIRQAREQEIARERGLVLPARVDLVAGTRPWLVQELMKRRGDLAGSKHLTSQYQEAINHAIRQAPRGLWARAVDDTTLDTADDTYRYSLAALTDITEAEQVQRVWIDDDDGVPREIGRWEVEDDEGVLTLVLDDDPGDTYDITLAYLLVPAELNDDVTAITLDKDWVLAYATVDLLMQADPTKEDARWLQAQIQVWDARRQAIEARQARRRGPRKARTFNWRSRL
jgi:hypothetical protein